MGREKHKIGHISAHINFSRRNDYKTNLQNIAVRICFVLQIFLLRLSTK